MTAERIGTNDLLHLGRQTVEPGAQIDRLAGEKELCSRRQADHRSPRTAESTRRSAFSLTPLPTRTPVRQIDFNHPDALRQGQTGAPRACRTDGLCPDASPTTAS